MADLDLARRAVACRGWRWMPGMRESRSGERHEDGDGPWIIGKRPDFDDAATLGCLLALAREAWKDPWLHAGSWTVNGERRWGVFISGVGLVASAPTEAEALILALEAADVR